MDKFAEIGQGYAGTGLSPDRRREPKKAAEGAAQVAFHGKINVDSVDSAAEDSDTEYAVKKPPIPDGKRNSNMQASMYAHALGKPGAKNKAPIPKPALAGNSKIR